MQTLPGQVRSAAASVLICDSISHRLGLQATYCSPPAGWQSACRSGSTGSSAVAAWAGQTLASARPQLVSAELLGFLAACGLSRVEVCCAAALLQDDVGAFSGQYKPWSPRVMQALEAFWVAYWPRMVQ